MALKLVKLVDPKMVLPMPNGADLGPEGALVDADTMFWLRRIADGDVIASEPPADPAPAPADADTPSRKR